MNIPILPIQNFCKQKLRPLSEQLEIINIRIPSIICPMPINANDGIDRYWPEQALVYFSSKPRPLGGVMLVVHPVCTCTPSGMGIYRGSLVI